MHPRRTQRAIAAIGCLLVSAGLALAASAPSADAAGSSCGTHSNFFSGVASDRQSSIFGSRAVIESTSSVDLCSAGGGSPSDSSVWAMVTAHNLNTPGDDYYAQIGYLKVGTLANEAIPAGFHIFSEWTKKCHPSCGAGVSPIVQESTGAPTTAVTYTNVYRASDGLIHMLWNGNELSVTGYNPTGDWASAWQAQFFAETQHKATDVVGTSGDKITYSVMQTYRSDGSLVNVPSFAFGADDDSRYHHDVHTPSAGVHTMDVWTQPIACGGSGEPSC